MVDAAVSMGQLTINSPTVKAMPWVTILTSSVEAKVTAQSRSPQANRKPKRVVATTPGRESGSTICKKVRSRELPSIIAASSIALGMVSK